MSENLEKTYNPKAGRRIKVVLSELYETGGKRRT